ncbi:SDR family oxidoreductase [Crocinitomicaceae bacterium CZZ-1]|uniref:SDR family oxidoreductase n=1 Tax=Taishania pollutisoli TaxID=2766479 RepID=A0A8J6PIW4_9FLAO|nr:SDR family oxidoreductase [Taishania pollutisoli]MBC9812471.1 SDR family oxidoreductase [Taishania pollutisoli]
MKLTGNTILITGGSSGIGLSLAKAFLELNNKVIITGRNLERLEKIKAQFPNISIFRCELSDTNSINELVTFIEQTVPDVNILLNNAAIQYNYSFLESNNLIDKIDYEVSTNLIAPMKLTALLLPVLMKNSESAIINVSSGLAISPKKSASVYCATKSAIHSFTKTLRYQLKDTNIRVFEIIPPLVETPMTNGRSTTKRIPPEQLTKEFLKNFQVNTFESYIGKSKLLRLIHRFSPKLADKIMRDGT